MDERSCFWPESGSLPPDGEYNFSLGRLGERIGIVNVLIPGFP